MSVTTLLTCLLSAALLGVFALPARAQQHSSDAIVVQAREALRKKDRNALASARQAVNLTQHPLAMWVEYWELGNRLGEVQQPELDGFYARWPGTYVEDRLRNDWLLELGRRRDWSNFSVEYPRFRMNDDRQVTCYALLTQHFDGRDVRAAAREAWYAQADLDDGCNLLAKTLYEAKVFSTEDVWQEARLAAEFNRPRAARAAVALIQPAQGETAADIFDNPLRFLKRKGAASREMTQLALLRLAANDPDDTAAQLEGPWSRRLPLAMTATVWAQVAKQAALKQLPQAADYARTAWRLWGTAHSGARAAAMQPAWSDDMLAWHVRAALREPGNDSAKWQLVQRASDAMSAAEQRDPAWVYWRARATQALARPGPEGDGARASAQRALQEIAPQMGFYGKLATEELGQRVSLPAPPAPLSAAEREATRANPGLVRALHALALGLRSEGVREWNFTLRGMSERELLAAAQWACEREVWDRCINTSDRTRGEVDLQQRFPTPWREQIVAKARDAGLDPAILFGLIRQESRFVTDARSGVGASGLMQLMPATARWTARKIGVEFRPEMITDLQLNLQLGAAYLKRVLDDFDGSLAMAAAAYNAGPGRPRRWREGPGAIEPAAWAETIPFNETRDYVKKVLSNSVYYAAMLGSPVPTLKSRLGAAIGPRANSASAPDRELP